MVWLVRVTDRVAQAMRADELYAGQVIVVPIVWANSATSRLHDRLKEIILGIRQDVADVPIEQRVGAVVAA
eukprot:7662665-Alexandrium_andersonii.AAC.1